jgi:nitrate/TMAO reductase-like tetraheme cytochrome c subunit
MMKIIIFTACLIFCSLSSADDFKIPENQKLKEECGSCHVVFPPQLMTADNWMQLMKGLDKHFGGSAAIDPADNQSILAVLQSNAGTSWKGMSSESGIRVIDTAWFTRKHRKIPNKLWFDDAVKSPSNCIACHVKADKGDWSEQSTRVPMPVGRIPKLN